MIERTISCAFDNGEKAYFVLPDPKSKTIHIIRGTVHETFITVNPNLDYEIIEYGVKFSTRIPSVRACRGWGTTRYTNRVTRPSIGA